MKELYENCSKCGAPQDTLNLVCASCGTNLGFPNVRKANLPDEVKALNTRVQKSEKNAEATGVYDEFINLMDAVDQHSKVIVSMPVDIALNIVTNIKYQFVNYERLVGAGVLTPAEFPNDAHRKIVAGTLFANFGEQIIYGALSLSERGLSTYGDIYCVLKEVAIDERTSFLNTNSYEFIEKYGNSNHPAGYRSDWSNRAKLVGAKLEENALIRKSQGIKDWEKIILVCDGKNRDRDEFIEAHIFGAFNVFSIEKMVAATPIDKKKKTMVKAVIEGFKSFSQEYNQ